MFGIALLNIYNENIYIVKYTKIRIRNKWLSVYAVWKKEFLIIRTVERMDFL